MGGGPPRIPRGTLGLGGLIIAGGIAVAAINASIFNGLAPSATLLTFTDPSQSRVDIEQSSTSESLGSAGTSTVKERISTSHGSKLQSSMMCAQSLGTLPL